MFKRLLVTDWMEHSTLIGFIIFFVAFIIAVIWVLRLPRERVSREEQLPFEPEHTNHEHQP